MTKDKDDGSKGQAADGLGEFSARPRPDRGIERRSVRPIPTKVPHDDGANAQPKPAPTPREDKPSQQGE